MRYDAGTMDWAVYIGNALLLPTYLPTYRLAGDLLNLGLAWLACLRNIHTYYALSTRMNNVDGNVDRNVEGWM